MYLGGFVETDNYKLFVKYVLAGKLNEALKAWIANSPLHKKR